MTLTSATSGQFRLEPLPPLKPELNARAWASIPHPTLPLLATCHAKAVTVYSLSTLSFHSTLSGGHTRSVRAATWKPALPPHTLCLATASFDATAALWRWDGNNHSLERANQTEASNDANLEVEITASTSYRSRRGENNNDDGEDEDAAREDDWEFSLVLEGHESEVKSTAFSPSGQYLATCSRDKSVWIWEDVGATEADDEWETVDVLNEHDGDVKCVAWCPDVPGRTAKGRYSSDVLASSSYDDTVRIWRQDGDGEFTCVAVLEGHQGTVWGIQWEASPTRTNFPRLLSFSADKTIRVWAMKQDGEKETYGHGKNPGFQAGLGGIPNRMRASPREEWECTATLPLVHTRDVYSATWSSSTGLVASTGSDGLIAIYEEEQTNALADGNSMNGQTGSQNWRILATVKNAHGPYEINHITWCKRYDAGTEAPSVEEMLVTTGDNGVVRPWRVIS